MESYSIRILKPRRGIDGEKEKKRKRMDLHLIQELGGLAAAAKIFQHFFYRELRTMGSNHLLRSISPRSARRRSWMEAEGEGNTARSGGASSLPDASRRKIFYSMR